MRGQSQNQNTEGKRWGPPFTWPLDEDRVNLQASSMLKSELVKRIASQNPHLFDRDIEKVVSAIFDEMVEAMRRGNRRTAGFRSFFS